MGSWAKSLFGREQFDSVGIVFAGTIKPDTEQQILGFFDEVLSSKDSVYHAHLVRKEGVVIPVVFNVYGAPAMMDVLTEMHDGGCRNVIFIGYAYGGLKENIPVGEFVLPEKAYHFHGMYHHSEPSRDFDVPDAELKDILERLLKEEGISFHEGVHITVPAVTFQLPHASEQYQKIDPSTVDMELAACFSRAKDIGIRAVGCLVISDNRSVSIGDSEKKQLRYEGKLKIAEVVSKNLKRFILPALKREKEFVVEEYLASVIDLPDRENVYRK